MKQEDINELISKYPSPEARIQHEERLKEAQERGCACADNPSGLDSNCFWDDHKRLAKGVK